MPRPLTRPPLIAIVLGLALTAASAIVPPAAVRVVVGTPLAPLVASLDAPAALAAQDLSVVTGVTYVVLPARAVVRVTVDITATNRKPNASSGGVVTRYYYDSLNLGVQPEARSLRATQGGRALAVTAVSRPGYRLATIRFRSPLFFGGTAKVRLAFDLPAGPPRSSSGVRVGPAFASFLAWAFGESGTVRVEVPAAFTVTTSGDEMASSTGPDGVQVFTASTGDAVSWFSWINARNDAGLTNDRVALPSGEDVIVRAWPEDVRWRKRVSSLLAGGVPALTARIGLPWPVQGPLSVLEIHTPLLEGYAGFYNPDSDEITVSEDLDDVTIIHEASHAWFNQRLFTERWITEGLAEEYAARVVVALGGTAPGPANVSPHSAGAFRLDDWPPPAPIRTETASQKEQFGYDAAYLVTHAIVKTAGEAGMRRAFASAAAGTTAYVGSASPERTSIPNDWRRFLDLTEEVGGATGVDALLRDWALTPAEAALLPARGTARTAYHALVAAGGTWAVPVVVRMAMDRWAFADATTTIAEASTILARRASIATVAGREGLDVPAGLESAYEAASSASSLDAVRSRAADTEASLEAIAAADAAAAAPRDWLTDLGLSGKDPDGELRAARSAWEAGDLAAATQAASLVVGTIAVAPDAGRGRALLIGGGVALALLLLVLVAFVVRRRQSARRRLAEAAAAAAEGPGAARGTSPLGRDEMPPAGPTGDGELGPPPPPPPPRD